MRRIMAVRPLVGDVLLALAVFALTADQGQGGAEFGVFGEIDEPAQTLIGALVALMVLLRRRTVVPLLIASVVVWLVMAAPWALMVAIATVSAESRRPRWYVSGVVTVAALVLVRLLVGTDASVRYAVLLTVLLVGTPLLFGLWVGARRALVATLRERAEQLEREQTAVAEQARMQERARIAREMHDVVAHRVSLMVVHAGALETNLADRAAARQAGMIREVGREALTDLRQVLSVLRDQQHTGAVEQRPSLDRLDELVGHSRDAGLPVSVRTEGERRELPATVERAVYRLLQEALTNVHKHAAGAATDVALCYHPDRVELSVRNARPAAPPDPHLARASAGHGLIGLRERIDLLNGTFSAAPRPDGGFEVRACIPTDDPA
jgi:signal transduction histidine kinase